MRQRLTHTLRSLGFDVLSSQANFVWGGGQIGRCVPCSRSLKTAASSSVT